MQQWPASSPPDAGGDGEISAPPLFFLTTPCPIRPRRLTPPNYPPMQVTLVPPVFCFLNFAFLSRVFFILFDLEGLLLSLFSRGGGPVLKDSRLIVDPTPPHSLSPPPRPRLIFVWTKDEQVPRFYWEAAERSRKTGDDGWCRRRGERPAWRPDKDRCVGRDGASD